MQYCAVGELAGIRQGTKNGKRWGNVYIDDPEHPMERTQLFLREELIDKALSIPVRSRVAVSGRMQSVNAGNGYRITLDSIEVK